MQYLIPVSFDYVTYARKSNGRKAVPRQKALVGQMIRKQDGVILDEFTDRDSTAFAKPGQARPKRDDFDRMIALLESRTGLRIAAYHADRLLRNSEDTSTLIRACVNGGHLIETYAGGLYDLSTANGRRRLRDDASAAEFEVDHNTERVLAGRDEVAAEGRWLGGKRPFGWEADEHPLDEDGEPMLDEDGKPVNGMLRLVPAEQAAILGGSLAILAGSSAAGIARQWEEAGLAGTCGGRWTGREVRRILMRPRNAGLMEHRGQVTGKASWPAIVDEPTWRAVCAVLSDPARKTTPGPARQHLLSGIARCATCGEGLTSTIRGGNGHPKRSVYACRLRRGSTAHVARDAAALEEYVTALAVARMSQPDAAALVPRGAAGELARLHAERAELDGLMRASNALRREGLLTPAEFAEERRGHQQRLARLDGEIEAASRSDVLAPLLADPARVWEGLGLDMRRAVVMALMEVTVLPQPRGRPPGWQPGQPYFDPDCVRIRWVRRLPSDG